MIVLDVNLLLYAYDGRATAHDQARQWWQSAISGPELIGLPWQTIHGFLRISTDTRISGNQVTMERSQIGRASCRERVSISVVAVSLKKKTKTMPQAGERRSEANRSSRALRQR